jgi:fructose-1,6-bisphosphatase/inositol monophosphatase family enzyme
MSKNNAPFTPINPHHLAVFFKDTTRRVIEEIRKSRMTFIAKEKETDSKKGIDFVTNVDTKCQEIWIKHCQEQYPFVGIIAEEIGKDGKEFFLPCSSEADKEIFFTIDPLDGTQAFIRGQSESFGTMSSLIERPLNQEHFDITAACVADAMTQEIYYFRPGSEKVHRFEIGELARKLVPNKRPLKEQYVLLRDDPRSHSESIQRITHPKDGLFKNIEVTSGSIGTNTAKLWKGQCGAYILQGGYDTPWDWNPVAGISKKLGFRMFELSQTKMEIVTEVPLDGIRTKTIRTNSRILIHSTKIRELTNYLQSHS